MKNKFKSLINNSLKINTPSEDDKDKLYLAGQIIKESRQRLGLSRANLSIKTKVSVTVLEALENGWINQLPEKPYLIKMIAELEDTLYLDKGSLVQFYKLKNEKGFARSEIFTPGNIEILTTWPGTILYFIILLFSIFLINKQQADLAKKQTQTIIPAEVKEVMKDRN